MIKLMCVCIIYVSVSISSAEEPTMYLCLDSMMQKFNEDGKSPQKLVYGYINGKKTECMSEYEFRARLSKETFEQKRSAEPDSQRLLETKGLRRKLPKTARNAIDKGNKNLAGADFRGCDLSGLDLSGANLEGANLESADLRGANLNKANLRNANLRFAYLKNADLQQADLTDSDLKGTYFQGADLTNTTGLNLENIRHVTSIYQSDLDAELLEAVKEYCPNRLKDPGFQWQTSYVPEIGTISDEERADRRKFR